MSRQRRLLLIGVAIVVGVFAVAALLARLLATSPPARAAVRQDLPGPVLLVPGYGGSSGALESLAVRLRAEGRTATVIALPGDGTGDLNAQVVVLDRAAREAVAAGAPSVDVVGYSAGGVVARLWEHGDGAGLTRRVVTLGSPHHGTSLAAIGQQVLPGVCTPACRQLVPGSALLKTLNSGDETPAGPQWLSLWTSVDETVTPPDSARLAGATDVVLQDVCPGARTSHGDLPRDPRVQGIVLAALGAGPITVPASCPS